MIKPGLLCRAYNLQALMNKTKNCLPVLVTQQEGLGATIFFLKWFYQCFIPRVKKYLEKKRLQFKALLIIGNAPSHPQAPWFTEENVEEMCLPPNTISLLQPLIKHPCLQSEPWFPGIDEPSDRMSGLACYLSAYLEYHTSHRFITSALQVPWTPVASTIIIRAVLSEEENQGFGEC